MTYESKSEQSVNPGKSVIQTNIPELRFKEFDGKWWIANIQYLIDNDFIIHHLDGNHGELYPRSEEFIESGIPYVSANDFIDGRVNLIDCKFLSEKRAKTFRKGIAIDGDVLFAHNATVGPTAVLKTHHPFVILSTTATYYRCNPERLSNYFLMNFFQSKSFVKQYFRVKSQSTRDQVPITQQRKFDACLPSLPEQEKIASFLFAVDRKIELLRRKKKLLEEYKKGVMQKLFSQEIRFKRDDETDFPDWKEKRLGDLTYKVGKKNKENIQYPIYSINNQEGFRPQSEQFEGLDSNERGYDISMYKIIYPETFAYNPARINVGSIGYSYDLNEVIISSLYVCFKTKDKLEDLYLLAFLDTYRFQKDILRFEEGGVRQYLFYENFSHIKIPIASNQEQIKIASYLSQIQSRIQIMNEQIELTQTFKKGLLQKMFV